MHAFAAAPASDADLLIILTPGVERFEYFRHLQRIANDETGQLQAFEERFARMTA